MSDGNRLRSALVRTACLEASLVALPIEVLLEVVSYTDVVSAIKMTRVSALITFREPKIDQSPPGFQTCKSLHALQESFSFWLLLLHALKSIRPVPRLAGQSTLDDVRQAVITAHKLHLKWSVRQSATPARSYALPPRLTASDEESNDFSPWTLLLNDGVHVLHSDIDNGVKLRRLDTGEIVWEFHSKSRGLGPPGCLDYTLYEEDINIIFDFPIEREVNTT